MNLLLFVPRVPPGQSFSLPLEGTAPTDATGVRLEVKLSRPLASSMASLQAAFATPTSEVGRAQTLGLACDTALDSGRELCLHQECGDRTPYRSSTTPLGGCASECSPANPRHRPHSTWDRFDRERTQSRGLLFSAGQSLLACALLAVPGCRGRRHHPRSCQFPVSAASALDACAPVINGAVAQIEAATLDRSELQERAGGRRFAVSLTSAVRRAGRLSDRLRESRCGWVARGPGGRHRSARSSQIRPRHAVARQHFVRHPSNRRAAGTEQLRDDLRHRPDDIRARAGQPEPGDGTLKVDLHDARSATRLPPSDPTRGFLPPNKDGVQGQGWRQLPSRRKESRTARSGATPRRSSSMRTRRSSRRPGSIRSDTTTPVSRGAVGGPRSGTSSLDVAWTGSDAGSGVGTFTVYVSDNAGPFNAWKIDAATTTATFDGINGHVPRLLCHRDRQSGQHGGDQVGGRSERHGRCFHRAAAAGAAAARSAATRSETRALPSMVLLAAAMLSSAGGEPGRRRCVEQQIEVDVQGGGRPRPAVSARARPSTSEIGKTPTATASGCLPEVERGEREARDRVRRRDVGRAAAACRARRSSQAAIAGCSAPRNDDLLGDRSCRDERELADAAAERHAVSRVRDSPRQRRRDDHAQPPERRVRRPRALRSVRADGMRATLKGENAAGGIGALCSLPLRPVSMSDLGGAAPSASRRRARTLVTSAGQRGSSCSASKTRVEGDVQRASDRARHRRDSSNSNASSWRPR